MTTKNSQTSKSLCKYCGAEIIWIEGANKKRYPCDPGKVLIVRDDGTVVNGYRSHFQTCPNVPDKKDR